MFIRLRTISIIQVWSEFGFLQNLGCGFSSAALQLPGQKRIGNILHCFHFLTV